MALRSAAPFTLTVRWQKFAGYPSPEDPGNVTKSVSIAYVDDWIEVALVTIYDDGTFTLT
jgi:hypothetical protein